MFSVMFQTKTWLKAERGTTSQEQIEKWSCLSSNGPLNVLLIISISAELLLLYKQRNQILFEVAVEILNNCIENKRSFKNNTARPRNTQFLVPENKICSLKPRFFSYTYVLKDFFFKKQCNLKAFSVSWGYCYLIQCTEMCFASFLSSGFTTITVIDPLESKLAKRTSVQCTVYLKTTQ